MGLRRSVDRWAPPACLLASSVMPRANTKGGKTAAATPDFVADPVADGLGDMPFEQAIQRLEGIVERLEDGELDLETSLSAFEEGVALSKRCASQLDSAERRIEILVQEGGQTLERPFDDAPGDAEESA